MRTNWVAPQLERIDVASITGWQGKHDGWGGKHDGWGGKHDGWGGKHDGWGKNNDPEDGPS